MTHHRILSVARDYKGPCFTDSFDKRTFFLSAKKQAKRKIDRLCKVIETEMKRDVDLKKPEWRKLYCIRNKQKYGSLLGKNVGAILTFCSASGGYANQKGVLPGADFIQPV